MWKWFERKRYELLYYLKKNVFRIPEGSEWSWYALVVRCIIFPSNWLDWVVVHREKTEGIDFYTRSIIINKKRISYEFLYDLLNMKNGECFKIRKVYDHYEYPVYEFIRDRRYKAK